MATKTVKTSVKHDTNIIDKSKEKTLDQLKESINKRYEDIEHNFYLIGLDLMKVNMYVKNFRKWVAQNTRIDVSTAYTLMRLVKRDKELSDSKKYQVLRPKICLTKLIRLLKYPADFVDKLDFVKEYDAPGGKKFTLLDMPTDLFAEAVAQEYKNLTSKEKVEPEDEGLPMDKIIIKQAKEKLARLLNDLTGIFTVLSELDIKEESSEVISTTIEEIEEITAQAHHINEIADKLLSSLKTQARAVAKAA